MARPAGISSEDLADAVVRIVVERGLEAVSVRAVAAEAGVSAGAVQHYYASKDELLLAAYRHAAAQFRERAQDLPDRDAEPLAYVRGLLRQLLPVDARGAAELRVAVAFTARSVHSPRLAELYEEGYGNLVTAVADGISQAIERGEIAIENDPRQAAEQMIGLADGLAWHSLCAPGSLSASEAAALLDQYLRGVLTQRSSG